MQTLTQTLLAAGLHDRILTEANLRHHVEGSDQRRYHLVNRALKRGELVRVTRGLYVLGEAWRTRPPRPFSLAQALVPGSYVSAESALAFHGWIPEGVPVTLSVTPGRARMERTSDGFGHFQFRPVPVQQGAFLEMVEHHDMGQAAWVAKPLRALLDMVYLNRLHWQGVDWLTGNLRIEDEQLAEITKRDIERLRGVYRHRRLLDFLDRLHGELTHE